MYMTFVTIPTLKLISTRIHKQNTEMNYINPIKVTHVYCRFLANMECVCYFL